MVGKNYKGFFGRKEYRASVILALYVLPEEQQERTTRKEIN